MTTSDMIRELCEKQNISLAELCRRIGQTPQNFNKKLKRGTVSTEEMLKIAVEEFSRLQNYMLSCEKSSETYKLMKDRYIELKVILTVSGINLTELDKIKE